MELKPEAERPRRRGYEQVLSSLETRWKRRPADRPKIMQDIVDALWDTFGEKTIAWCGFYLITSDGQTSVLGPHRDGAPPSNDAELCRRAAAEKKTHYISMADIERNPALQAEIAVPVLDLHSGVFAVINLISVKNAAFGEEDRRWLERLIRFLEQKPDA